jgi:hypothetical protein
LQSIRAERRRNDTRGPQAREIVIGTGVAQRRRMKKTHRVLLMIAAAAAAGAYVLRDSDRPRARERAPRVEEALDYRSDLEAFANTANEMWTRDGSCPNRAQVLDALGLKHPKMVSPFIVVCGEVDGARHLFVIDAALGDWDRTSDIDLAWR